MEIEGEPDPDLLLALALSQSFLGSENTNDTNIYSSENATLPEESKPVEKKEEVNPNVAFQQKFFQDIIEAIQINNNQQIWDNFEGKFTPLVNIFDSFTRDVLTIEIVDFLISFTNALWQAILLSIDENHCTVIPNGIFTLSKSTFKLCLTIIDYIQELEEEKTLKNSKITFGILKNLLLDASSRTKNAVTQLTKDVKSLSIPNFGDTITELLSLSPMELVDVQLAENKYFVNRLLSFTPKDSRSVAAKFNGVRNTFYQRNAEIFTFEINGIEKLIEITTQKLPKRNFFSLEPCTPNSIYYVKKIMEILGNLPITQESDHEKYLCYSAELFVNLVYTLSASAKCFINCKSTYVVESETLEGALHLLKLFGGATIKTNFIVYFITYFLGSLSHLQLDSLFSDNKIIAFEEHFDLRNFQLVFNYFKTILTTYTPKPVSSEFKSENFTFDGFNCLEYHSREELQNQIESKVDIGNVFFTLLGVGYQQMALLPYIPKEEPKTPVTPANPPSVPEPPPLPISAKLKGLQEMLSLSFSGKKKEEVPKVEAKEEKPLLEIKIEEKQEKGDIEMKEEKPDNSPVAQSTLPLLEGVLQILSSLISKKYLKDKDIKDSCLDVLLHITKYQSSQPTKSPLIQDETFQKHLRTFYFSLLSSDILSEEHIQYILRKIGISDSTWPLFVPLEHLVIATRIISTRFTKGDTCNIIKIWNGLLESLRIEIGRDSNMREEVINPENLDFVLFTFYLLPNDEKIKIFSNLVSVLGASRGNAPQLALCRVFLMIDFLGKSFDTIPEALERRIENNFFTSQKPTFLKCPIESTSSKSPMLYLLVEPAITTYKDSMMSILLGEGQESHQRFFEIINLLNVSNSQPVSSKEDLAFDTITAEYYFKICWGFVNSFPSQISAFFGKGQPNEVEKNQLLLLLCYVSKKSTGIQTTESEIELVNYLQSLLIQLKSFSTDFNETITGNSRALTLLHGIIQIFNTSFKPIESESEGAEMIGLFAEEDSEHPPVERVESPEPLKVFYQANLESIIQCFLTLSSELITLLKNFRLKNFPGRREDFILVDLLLRTNATKDGMINAIKKIVSPEAFEIVKDWSTSAALNLKDVKDVTEKLSLSFIILDQISMGEFVLESSFKTVKIVLNSLVEQLLTLLECSKDLKVELSPETMNRILILIININTDNSIKFLSPKKFNFNSYFEKESVKISVYSHSVKVFESIYRHLTNTFPINDPVFDACEDPVRSCLKFTTDALKKPALAKHFAGVPDLFPIPAVLELSSATRNTIINQHAYELFNTILRFTEDKEIPYLELKNYTISCFMNVKDEVFGDWINVKLLGESAELRKHTVKLLYLLSTQSVNLQEKILNSLNSTFKTAFIKWNVAIKDFFPLFKKLSFQAKKLPELLKCIFELVESDEFKNQDKSKDSYLDAVELIVKFLSALFQLLGAKKSENIDNMDIVDESTVAEQELCKQLCTYTITENTFMDQHWYYCFSCNLTFSEGVCSTCAKVCHAGHEVTYARKSRFFCDCGAASKGIACKCLQPRIYEAPKPSPNSVDNKDDFEEIEELSDDERQSILSLLKQIPLVNHVAGLYSTLLESLQKTKHIDIEGDKPKLDVKDLYATPKKFTKGEIFALKKQMKLGFDVKLKADGPETREIKQLLHNKVICKQNLCYSANGFFAIADNSGVNIGIAPKLFDKDANPLDKSAFKSVSKVEVQFQVLYMSFNPLNPNFLSISGLSESIVVTLNAKGEVVDQLNIDLALDSEEENIGILEVAWLPGSQVKIAIITSGFVKIFDLSKDNMCPLHYFMLLEDSIRDGCCMEDDQGVLYLLAIAVSGMIFVQQIFDVGDGGPCIMIEAIGVDGKFEGKGGSSIYYSKNLDLVFVSYGDGKSFAGKLDKSKNFFTHSFVISAPESGPFASFVEFPDDVGTIVCVSKRAAAALALKIQKEEIAQQAFKVANVKVDSICAVPVKGKSENPCALLILTDDSSINRFDLTSLSEEAEKKEPEPASKLASFMALIKEEKPQPKVTFPIDYFEHVECITPTIELAGDVLLYYKSEAAKQRLASNEEYLTSSNSDFKIVIKNPNSEMVMVGIRILVGNAAQQCIPKTISIFDRVIQCKSARRWYDIPFSVEECLKADKEFSFTASGAQSDQNAPVIDSLEVYGKSKEAFGWKEKLTKYSTMKPQKVKLPPETKLENCLIQTAESLSCYFKVLDNEEKQNAIESYPTLVSNLPPLLNEPFAFTISSSLKHLLSSLHGNKTEYYKLKDRTQLEYVAKKTFDVASDSGKVFSESELHKAIATCRQIISQRERNFFQFIHETSKFPASLMKSFWLTMNKPAVDWKLRQAIVSDIIKVLQSYTKYLQIVSKQSDLSMVKSGLKFLLELVSSTDEFIRLTSAKVLQSSLSDIGNEPISEDLKEFAASQMDTEDFQEVDEEMLIQMALEMSLNNQSPSLDKPLTEYSVEQLLFIYFMEQLSNMSKLGGVAIAYALVVYSIIKKTKSEETYNERINLLVKTIFEAKIFELDLSKRSPQIEFVILILILLDAIISDPSNPNDKNCCLTCCKELDSYSLQDTLLLFLESLYVQFKKLPKDKDGSKDAAANGSLLVPSTKAPVESLLPFFTDVYAKQNSDLFSDHKRLFAASTLCLSQVLIKKNGCPNIEGWTQTLCKYLNTPQTEEYVGVAKNILRSICKDQYNTIRDAGRYEYLYKKLKKLHTLSNSFKVELSYSDSVLLITTLASLWHTISSRPANWKKYITDHKDLVTVLFDSSFYLGEEPAQLVLKVLGYIFGPENFEEKKEEKKEEKSEKEGKDESKKVEPKSEEQMVVESESSPEVKPAEGEDKIAEEPKKEETIVIEEVAPKQAEKPKEKLPYNHDTLKEFVEFFMQGDELSRFVNIFLLEYNNSNIRSEARNIIHWMWPYASVEQKDFIFEFLQNKINSLPSYGRNATEFVELLSFCATNIDLTRFKDTLSTFLKNIITTLKSQNHLLINHPNSYIYQTISTLLDFDGYFLESEPCLVCNDPEIAFSSIKLDSLKTESKYTASTQLIKFINSVTIQSISADITDIHKSCMAKTINFYYNNKPVQDLTELKNKWSAWKKAKSITLSPAQSEFTLDFPIPITATNFLIEYSTFYENLQSMERLTCPRCNRVVTDRYGVCNNCFENAYQCRQCRNINYEALNAFLCNECGYCNNAEIIYTLSAKPSFACEKMESDEDRDKGLQLIEKESANAHKKYLQLMTHRNNLASLTNKNFNEAEHSISLAPSTGKINPIVSTIAVIYGKECRSAFDSLSKSTQLLMGTRKELVKYNSKLSVKPDVVDARVRPANKCFGCANSFISLCLSLIENFAQFKSVRRVLIDRGLIHELISNNLLFGDETTRTDARRIICLLIKDDQEATNLLNKLLSTKLWYCIDNHKTLDLSSCIRNEMLLLVEMCQVEDSCWELRLKLLFELFFHSIRFGAHNPIISEQVILPCLRQIVAFTKLVDKKNFEHQTRVKYSDWSENKTTFEEWKSTPEISDLAHQLRDEKKYELSRKVLRLWKKKASVSSQTPPRDTTINDFIVAPWISTLMFSKCSFAIRTETASLIKSLCTSEERSMLFLETLTTLIPTASEAGDKSVEFFKLYESFITSSDFVYRKVKLTLNGFLSNITQLISAEIKKIKKMEDTFSSDISQGFVLYTLINILLSFLEVPCIRRIFKTEQLMIPILDGFLSLRGIIVQKTKLIDDSATALLTLLKSFTVDEQDNQLFILACIKALENHQTGRTPIFIFEQLCGIICPKIPEPVYYLDLVKSHTQEDFFRGSMNKNPYSSTETGPLMRDVRNKICRDLDLFGLDEGGMELIVCGKIIKLDLSVKQVYEQVWKAENDASTPMTVVYRLQGLDGEATEEFIETLPDEEGKEEDPEEKYAITSIMSTCGGLEAIIAQIQNIEDFTLEKELANYGLKLLYHCLKVKVNRLKILELKSMNILLDKLKLTFPKESLADIAELLLLTIESIVSEANERDDNSMDIEQKLDSHQIEEGVSQMMMFLEKLGSPLVRCNPRIVKSVTRIIPVLTYGQEQIASVLLNYFLPYLDFSSFDDKQYDDATHSFFLDCFASITNSIRLDPNGMKLKEFFFSEKIVDNLYQYILNNLPSGKASDVEWKEKASKGSLPYVLLSLTGLTKGYSFAQLKALETGVVPIIYQLCQITTKNKIGNLAENLIDSLVYNNEIVAASVEECRKLAKQEKDAEAKRHREKVLAAMGIKESEGKLQAAKKFLEDMDIEEESGLSCKVCKEGYTCSPTEMLGFYVFSKRVQIAKAGNRQDQGYITVTNFNVIHFQCHKEAAKADYELKPRKEEWEGAALRNSSTKCNNIFPIFGPEITEDAYNQSVERYWNTLLNSCGRCESTRFRLLAHDIRFLLGRLSTESSFSEDSRGGNKESNFISIPFYVQMGLYLLDQAGSAQRRVYEAALIQFLKQEKQAWSLASAQPDNTLFALILSLHLQTLEEWKACKKYFLDRSIIQAFVDNLPADDKKADSSPDAEQPDLFKACRPMLIYILIVDKLQEALKKPSGTAVVDAKAVLHNADEEWVESMKQRLKGSAHEITEDCKEILREAEQETLFVFENFDEFFDISGIYSEILAEASSSDEYVDKLYQQFTAKFSSPNNNNNNNNNNEIKDSPPNNISEVD